MKYMRVKCDCFDQALKTGDLVEVVESWDDLPEKTYRVRKDGIIYDLRESAVEDMDYARLLAYAASALAHIQLLSENTFDHFKNIERCQDALRDINGLAHMALKHIAGV